MKIKRLKKLFYEDMYEFKLNGAALAGWLSASIYGVIALIKNVIDIFN
ncbi:hypothetical protein [Oceanobacillus oncorhynchi]|nr:hypothetical protein [Oceanobacillus oncorhynchi]